MYPGSGETGSPIENEAHVIAGIIMRHFNKKYPEAVLSKPLELDSDMSESWSKKYKKSIDCNNPRGFSQKAHCAGRKARQAGKKTKSSSVSENFADGRNPQDRGDSARHGIPKKASLAALDKIVHSKTASPRKKQLAHWQANMRRGRNK